MARRVATILVLLLTLQWFTAAVAATCLHEGAGPVSDHVGHHEHVHAMAAAHSAAASVSSDVAGFNGSVPFDSEAHADCASCHLTAAAVLPALGPSAAGTPVRSDLSARLEVLVSAERSSLFRPPRRA